MIYIAEILLIIFNVLMANYHAQLIKKGKTPEHGLWGAAYLAVAGLFSFLNHSWLLLIASLLIRKVVFDLSLNTFRKLPLFYVSSSTTSIIDKVHYKIFGKKSEIYMAIYSAGIIAVNFFL